MKRKKLLIVLSIAILCLLIICISLYAYKKMHMPDEEKPAEIVELANIPGYNYTLEDRDTEIYKSTFEELKEVLSQEEVNYESYAELLAKLYIIDLYTISNKMNHYDVGGADFVVESSKESFEERVKDTIYKYVEDNSYGKRNQELPEVTTLEVSNIEPTTVKNENETYDGYTLNITWDYVKDLGYDKDAKITLIKLDDKLYVANQSASI